MTEKEFMNYMDDKRDSRIWKKMTNKWKLKDSIVKHKKNRQVEKARLKLSRVDTYKRIGNPIDNKEDNKEDKHIIM